MKYQRRAEKVSDARNMMNYNKMMGSCRIWAS